MTKAAYSILIFLNIILFISCGEENKKAFTNPNMKGLQTIAREIAIQDSINKAEWDRQKKNREEMLLAAKPYDRHGNFDIDETGYLGDLQIKIEKITKRNPYKDERSLAYHSTLLNQNSYLIIYVKVKNIGDKTLEVPFLFYQEPESSIRSRAYDDGSGTYSYYQLGMRMFVKKNKNGKYSFRDVTVKPDEEIEGRYISTIQNPSIALEFSFGDEKKEDDDIPPYYFKDNMKCTFTDAENKNVLRWSIVENKEGDTDG